MTPLEFVEKWRPVTLSERATAQSHFRDLCLLFDHPDPITADPKGEWFTYEKGLVTASGTDGFADVWMRDHFAWEYKKRKRNLDEALGQLARYALALENPPLHIACDTDRFRIVTAWTNTVPKSFDLSLEDLLVPEKREIVRSAFYHPDSLKPGATRDDLTKVAASKFSAISARLQERGHTPTEVAHFVSRLVFLFFAEDVRLLPGNYFRRVLHEMSAKPRDSKDLLDGLFAVLKSGGRFGVDRLPHVNGGLFDNRSALPLDEWDIQLLRAAGSENWAHIDPSIFGTLFERLLDPDKRAQIGAHYTDAKKIMMILEPVILRPLRSEWECTKETIVKLVSIAHKKGPRAKEWRVAEEKRSVFLERLRTTSVLDAACGSGNFLYLALQAIKNLEHGANQECESLGLPPRMPIVGPEIVHGIEINPLAAELARTTIWIGDIQWSIQNGFHSRPEPILRPLETIECRDALIEQPKKGTFIEAKWPDAEFIVGNPPFLGGKLLRLGSRKKTQRNNGQAGLGDEYVDTLFEIYGDRIPADADFVSYWFEKASAQLAFGKARRIGLVATNSIRGGANRQVLEKAIVDNPIFEAWSDEPWIIDGAAVRVSLVCFGKVKESEGLRLNGNCVTKINSDLTDAISDLTKAEKLNENRGVCFQGIVKVGDFDIPGDLARQWLTAPANANGRTNRDVIRPWMNGADIVRRPSDYWIVDFGDLSERQASYYELPFEYVRKNIKSARVQNRDRQRSRNWWRLGRSGSDVKTAIQSLKRCIVTPRVAKHRIFAWASKFLTPDSAIVVIARDDDTTFGILHSRFHEAWSLRLGTSLEDRPRYTPTTTFETFPFPEALTPNVHSTEYPIDSSAIRIAVAAKKLNDCRQAWLNPPDLVTIEPEVVSGYPDRIVPISADAHSVIEGRTLTKLYNEHPTWLEDLHQTLDAAVAAAYGWPEDISTEDAVNELFQLNLKRVSRSKTLLQLPVHALPE